jgi:sugar lactone lactonase YvrE
MRYLLLCAALCACAAAGGRIDPAIEAPVLQVEFDSATVSARLRWNPVADRFFIACEVQRAVGEGQEFVSIARSESAAETTAVDSGLAADTLYRYRLLLHHSRPGRAARVLQGNEVEGGIHRRMSTWHLPAGFLPTRLAVDGQGVVYVVGAGAARVERFDRAGHGLGSWGLDTGPLACLEATSLETPALAVDRFNNLYVTYNLLVKGKAPRSQWTKFDGRGRRIWTRALEGIFARSIAVDPEGQVFIEGLNQLYQFTADGEPVNHYPLPALPASSLHFWKGHFAVLVYPHLFTDSEWQAPRLVAYSGPEREEAVMIMGRDPASPEDSGGGLLQRPLDFAVDESGSRAFVLDAGYSGVAVFRHSRFLTSWGKAGHEEGAFRLSGAVEVVEDLLTGATVQRQVVAGGIARDQEGYLYVADTFNNRIQKFRP